MSTETMLAAVHVVGWTAALVMWVYANGATRSRDAALRDFDDLMQDHNALSSDFLDSLDGSDKQIAKLRWRLAERGRTRDVPSSGWHAMHLNYAAEMRRQGWKSAHANAMHAARSHRQSMIESGNGLP